MKVVLSLMIFLSASAFGDRESCGTNCNGNFLSCRDNSSGEEFTFMNADTCVKCYNASTGEKKIYGFCQKDGGGIIDPGGSWDCAELR